MDLFAGVLLAAALLCSLVAGFLFAFAVVVMPGLAKLDDGGFIRGFQVMDGVIQERQPLFMLVWAGSVIALLAAAVLAFQQGQSTLPLVLGATALYLLTVQAPTVIINIPLNNEIQSVDVDALSPDERTRVRARFETRWNGSNRFRTVASIVTAALLLAALLRVPLP